MTDHTIAIANDWSLWRWSGLRGAGFPVALLHALAAPALIVTETELLAREAAADACRADLEARCETVLRAQGADVARWARKAVRRLRQRAVPEPFLDPVLEVERVGYAARLADVEAARRAVGVAFEAARIAAARWLRAQIGDDRFQCAILWQNRRALAAGIHALLRAPLTADDSKTRQNERLVASYLQRYCAKNDTIGFFGPVGWARLSEAEAVVAQRPGPAIEATRRVYFEYWAIDALAAQLAADPALRVHLAPRLLPQFRVDGTTLWHGERANELPPEFAAVASAADGEHSPLELAAQLALDVGELCEMLDELAESGVVAWTLEIPTATAVPEVLLAELLARIADPDVRAEPLAVLDRLLARRAEIAAATSAPTLDAALSALDDEFTAITGQTAEREGGKTYAGRTLVYEDCRRDTEVVLGAPFLARLAAPLALILTSARWFTHEIAARYRSALHELYTRLADTAPALDFQRFWKDAIALFPGPSAGIVAGVRDELHRRWREVLAIDRDDGVVMRRADAIAAHAAFAAPGPGWRAARYQCPDVLVAARGADAFARGDFAIVLGEVHVGFNTLGPLFVKEHPTPEVLVADRDRDLGRPGIAPVWSKAITRGDYYSLSPHDLDLEVGATRSARPCDHVIPISALEVAIVDNALVVRTRDGTHAFDIIEFLEHHLIAESFSAFAPLAAAPRTPRIVIDDVVIARETWRIDPTALAWPRTEDAVDRFLAARSWGRSLGMPRHVFVKTPEETKPTYVDFDSPIFVDMLAKSLRGATAAALSEMLPAPDEAWLEDGAGNRYTSELRIVAVDAS